MTAQKNAATIALTSPGVMALDETMVLHRPGEGPDPADLAGGYGLLSRPTADGTGWEHAVSHFGAYGHRDHTFVLRCLPASELPGAVGITSVTAIPTGRTRGLVPNGELTGGLSTSAPAFDGSGWHVTGVGPGGGTLVVTARCVARPRVVTGDAWTIGGISPGTHDRLRQ